MNTTTADDHFAAWMRGNLTRAAEHFDLTVTGDPVFGWRLRSISAPVVSPEGERWLRVVSQEPEWASGDHWTGTVDANMITGIRKPRVLDVFEWSDGRRQRAEIMTRLRGETCSPTDALRTEIELPSQWWDDLRGSLAAVAATPTRRVNADQAKITGRIHQRFGDAVDPTVTEWATVHGDVHWSNLFAPEFGLVDWELWGIGPAGADAATLLCYSLLVPTIAERVHELFADRLDTPTGRIAQLNVAARLFNRIDGGDYPDLTEPLDRHVRGLLA